MTRYYFKKVSELALLLIGITFISFLEIRLAPGTPIDAKSEFNPKMTAQAKEKLKSLYGLDRPLLTQYADWAWRIARLDFGSSFVDGEKVISKIGKAVPITLMISLLSLFLIFLAGIPLGIAGAVKKGTLTDRWLTFLSLAGFSLPTFWVALLLMSFFGVKLGVLPVAGIHSLFYEEMNGWEQGIDLARHLLLPVLVASITGIAGISRYARNNFSEVLRQNYIRTARAKGLPENKVLYRHALRNALLPVITLLGLSIPGLLGGSVIFETIFSIPGMGRLFFNSVFARDYPVIMGMLVLGAVMTLAANRLADFAYGLADPRIRKERR